MASKRLLFAGLLASGCLAGVAHAANYKHPYTNVDPRNDAENDTGDAVVDQLNNAQLQHPGVVTGPVYPAFPGYYAGVVASPPRYYTPPPGYVVAPAYPAYGYGW